jgi:hypothetical protein
MGYLQEVLHMPTLTAEDQAVLDTLKAHQLDAMDIKIYRLIYRLMKNGLFYYQEENTLFVEHWGLFDPEYQPALWMTYENDEWRLNEDVSEYVTIKNPFHMLEAIAERCEKFEKLLYTIEL